MRKRITTATSIGEGRSTVRKAVVLVTMLGAVAALAGSANAGSLPAAGSGTISVGSIDGQTMTAATVVPRYQSKVAFTTSGTARLKNPRVWVACYQSGVRVYAEGGSPSSAFKLGGDMSQWVLNGGGDATCTADLYYILNAKGTGEWTGKGAQGGNISLAKTGFDAKG